MAWQHRIMLPRFLIGRAVPHRSEKEIARKVIRGGSQNVEIANALCAEIFAKLASDHSRVLIALSVLGEMQSPQSEVCLPQLVQLPLPTTGTVVEGEILEQTALATLQAKAIEALAYRKTANADNEVLRAVAQHPSRVVRAAAINAYLWNHGDSPEAKRALSRYVRKGEEIFLDRIRREPGEKAASFNRKLKAFLAAHPELRPPAPERDTVKADKSVEGEDAIVVAPPELPAAK